MTAGLRLYHERHGALVDELMVTMPISIRVPGDAEGGNRITLMRIALPVGVADPVERIARSTTRAAAARREPSLKLTQSIAGGLNLLPRWYIGAILRHVDFLASNVPGVPVPVWVGGAAVTMQYAFGPTIGAGVNVTLITYQDTCALGINADSGAIPDLPVFRECLVAGFDEVLALGRETPRATPPATRRTTRSQASRPTAGTHLLKESSTMTDTRTAPVPALVATPDTLPEERLRAIDALVDRAAAAAHAYRALDQQQVDRSSPPWCAPASGRR